MLKAVIWDVDGTVAETERDGHRIAFNQALMELGAPWQWDVTTYGRLLRVTGGFERLLFDMSTRPDAPPSDAERALLARTVHLRKNEIYADLIAAGAISARPGVARLMDECEAAGIQLAVATTTSRSNVEALFASLFGKAWRRRFAAVVCAEDAPAKKPDPQAYRLTLERLGITVMQASNQASNQATNQATEQVIAIEDSPNGLMAATAAGIVTLVTRSAYFAGDEFAGCAAICDDLDHELQWAGGSSPRTDIAALTVLLAARTASQSMTRH